MTGKAGENSDLPSRPKEWHDAEFPGFSFSLEYPGIGNPGNPGSASGHRHTHTDTDTDVYTAKALSSQRMREEAAYWDRKLLENNLSTVANQHREKQANKQTNYGLIPTHSSKDWVGSLDFQSHQAITRCLDFPHKTVSFSNTDQSLSGKPGLSTLLGVMKPIICGVGGDMWGARIPTTAKQ